MLSYSVDNNDVWRRLESFLARRAPKGETAYFRKLIKNGAVRINAVKAAPDQLLQLHDVVTCKESATLLALLQPVEPLIDILYEDHRILVANKPAGLAMHRTAEDADNLVDVAAAWMQWRETPCKLYPVNRLDRGTSGVVILAKSSASAGLYGRQVKETGLDKRYLALVSGMPEDSGVITEPLDDKESETRFMTMARGNGGALLLVTPISGRMHQIRRHLALTGHPVIGDKRYGGILLSGYAGFALHSFRTVIPRPDGDDVTVYAPLSGQFRELCFRYGIIEQAVVKALAEGIS